MRQDCDDGEKRESLEYVVPLGSIFTCSTCGTHCCAPVHNFHAVNGKTWAECPCHLMTVQRNVGLNEPDGKEAMWDGRRRNAPSSHSRDAVQLGY